ncbi:MAG TPA: DUF2142 domain-containing protein [Candidatus Saccharimonadales bacterium]
MLNLLTRVKRARPIDHPAATFAVLALVFGLFFVFVTPPFFNADEPNHFLRVYQLSEEDLIPEAPAGMLAGGNVPASIETTINMAAPGTLNTQPLLRYSARFFFHEMRKTPLKPSVQSYASFPDTAIYSPVTYAPELIAVKLLALIKAPVVYMLYLGRIFGLVATVAIFAYAIRKIPFGKWGLVAIGLLPMSVNVFATFGADSMTLAVGALFVAMVANFAYHKKDIANNLDTWVLLGAAVALALCKTTYSVLLPLLLVLPFYNPKLRTKRGLLKVGLLLALSLSTALVWQHLTRIVTTISGDPTVNPKAQFAYIKHHSWQYISGPLAQGLLTAQSNGIIVSIFGVFAWLSTPLPYMVVLLETIVLALCCGSVFPGEIKKGFDLKALRRFSSVIAILCAVVMATALYAYWSPVGSPIILGLQGRYFIPLLALLVPAMKVRRFVLSQRTVYLWAAGGSLASLIVTSLVLASRFYTL